MRRQLVASPRRTRSRARCHPPGRPQTELFEDEGGADADADADGHRARRHERDDIYALLNEQATLRVQLLEMRARAITEERMMVARQGTSVRDFLGRAPGFSIGDRVPVQAHAEARALLFEEHLLRRHLEKLCEMMGSDAEEGVTGDWRAAVVDAHRWGVNRADSLVEWQLQWWQFIGMSPEARGAEMARYDRARLAVCQPPEVETPQATRPNEPVWYRWCANGEGERELTAHCHRRLHRQDWELWRFLRQRQREQAATGHRRLPNRAVPAQLENIFAALPVALCVPLPCVGGWIGGLTPRAQVQHGAQPEGRRGSRPGRPWRHCAGADVRRRRDVRRLLR